MDIPSRPGPSAHTTRRDDAQRILRAIKGEVRLNLDPLNPHDDVLMFTISDRHFLRSLQIAAT